MLLRHPIWFRLLRFRCRGAEKREAYNRALEPPAMGFIFGQRICPQFQVGRARMAGVGCEIAAVYNALLLCGRGRPCAELIRIFEKKRFLVAAGVFGSDPYAIGSFLESTDIPFDRYADYDAMQETADSSRGREGVFIVSFWNRRRIWGGLHTIAFFTKRSDRDLHVLNFYGRDEGVRSVRCFSDLTDAKRFITGYRLTADV